MSLFSVTLNKILNQGGDHFRCGNVVFCAKTSEFAVELFVHIERNLFLARLGGEEFLDGAKRLIVIIGAHGGFLSKFYIKKSIGLTK